MNARKNRQTKTMMRARQFIIDHPLDPPNSVVSAAFAALGAAITRIETLDGTRLHGTSTARGAVEERILHRKALRAALSDLSRVSKTLDPAAHPDIAAQLKMGRLNSHAELLAYARNAIAVIDPMKDVFIAHGAPTTLIEDIQALIDAFVFSGDRRNRGLGTQIRCNADLAEAVRAGMRQVRVLDAVLSLVLKSAPGRFAEWKAAMRVERSLPAQTSSTGAAFPSVSATPIEMVTIPGSAGPTVLPSPARVGSQPSEGGVALELATTSSTST